MLLPIFRGRVNPEGRLLLRETEREKRQAYLLALAARSVEVLVRPEPRQRTLDQNGYIHHVPVTLVARHTGHGIDETKELLMAECWGRMRDPKTGALVPAKGHTSSMDVEEATFFIEWAPSWALEHLGIDIPLPNEVEWRL